MSSSPIRKTGLSCCPATTFATTCGAEGATGRGVARGKLRDCTGVGGISGITGAATDAVGRPCSGEGAGGTGSATLGGTATPDTVASGEGAGGTGSATLGGTATPDAGGTAGATGAEVTGDSFTAASSALRTGAGAATDADGATGAADEAGEDDEDTAGPGRSEVAPFELVGEGGVVAVVGVFT
jgi:hypothetical protein